MECRWRLATGFLNVFISTREKGYSLIVVVSATAVTASVTAASECYGCYGECYGCKRVLRCCVTGVVVGLSVDRKTLSI